MKRIVALLMIAAMLLALTGCKSFDYKKAMELYENEDFQEAEEIFASLGDYEDSQEMVLASRYGYALVLVDDGEFEEAVAIFEDLEEYEDSEEYLENMPCHALARYLKKNGEVSYKDAENEYTVALSLEGKDVFVLEYHIEASADDLLMAQDFVARIPLGGTRAELVGEGLIEMGEAYMDDKGTGYWDIANYAPGDNIDWENYEISGQKVDGSDLDAGSEGLATLAEPVLERMVSGLEWLLEQHVGDIGYTVTLGDMGFTALN